MKKLLTVSVITMGVLILAGLAALVIGIINQAGKSGPVANQPAADPGAAIVVRRGLPAQTKVLGLHSAGQALAIHLDVPDRGQWVYLVPSSGRGQVVKIAVSAGK